jgi:hypothetical protein
VGEVHETICVTGHGRHAHHDLIARLLGLDDATGNIPNSLHVTHAGSAELLDDQGHDPVLSVIAEGRGI